MKRITKGMTALMADGREGRVTKNERYDDNAHRFVQVKRGARAQWIRTDRIVVVG